MKKVFIQSLLDAEIAAFMMLMVLFFINTNRPYLLLIPVIFGIGGYIAFAALLRKLQDKNKRTIILLSATLTVLLGFLIAASVIGLFYIL